MADIIQLNQAEIKSQLGDLVRQSVEDTLNAMLDAEADQITQAHKYERTEKRLDTRAGHYNRKLATKAGEVTLRVPKLRTLPFDAAIIERYKRREESVEEALIEMYLAGVSVRRVEDISEALWGAKVSPGTISNLNQKAYVQIEEWRNRKLEVEYPYVYLDGIYLKKNWGGTIENIAILVALGVNSAGNREIIGAAEGGKEDKESWLKFLRSLKARGLSGTRVMVGDKCLGLVEAIREVFPDTEYQRCIVHFMRNVFCNVPRTRGKEIGAKLKAIFAQEDREACLRKAEEVAQFLRDNKMKTAASTLESGIQEALTYTSYPHEHWLKIRSNNGIERINREIRRRTNAVGAFPDGNSALMLVCARLRFVSASEWGVKTYLNMERLYELEREREAEKPNTSS
ncbi:MAG: IS256 family transposase [Bacteroidales bacterium]|nr:IS256 family transposase [Bacteroidales bacterium]